MEFLDQLNNSEDPVPWYYYTQDEAKPDHVRRIILLSYVKCKRGRLFCNNTSSCHTVHSGDLEPIMRLTQEL
jgi:hypothetical protein